MNMLLDLFLKYIVKIILSGNITFTNFLVTLANLYHYSLKNI